MQGSATGVRAASFVVPLFNEFHGVEDLWSAIRAGGDALVERTAIERWDAVIVDDGSTDGSAQVLDALAARDDRLKVIHLATNQGVGLALRTGLAAAEGDIVIYTDADLPFDLDQVPSVVRPVLDGKADLLSAKRRGRARESWWRAVESIGFNAIVRVVFRLPMHDVNFACKVANRHAIPATLVSDGALVDLEWLLRARDAGCRLVQVPIEFTPRRLDRSKLGSPTSVPGYLKEMVALRSVLRADRDHAQNP